jgi:hypothetical protein
MTTLNTAQALENVYLSLENNNHEIDTHIAALKTTLGDTKTVVVDAARLAQNNRQGRKLMQSYFKKRGVIVTFTA